jgi:hypothetical protein
VACAMANLRVTKIDRLAARQNRSKWLRVHRG